MTIAPEEVERTSADSQTGEEAQGLRSPLAKKIVRYAGMPIFLAIVLTLLYVYIQGHDLDSIEARVLARPLLQEALRQHIWLSVVSTVVVLLLAVPLGIFATRPGSQGIAPFVIGAGNAGQAIPSLGMLALIYFAFTQVSWLPSTGRTPVVVALVAYSFLPILRNTMVGLQQVDADMLEAGRGMGMSNTDVLRKIELPLAVPVILAGVRTALVLNVGTATLAFLFGAGGLGNIILRGLGLQRTPVLVTGAVLTAVLALLVDYLAGLVEEWLTPRGL
jgi:osmoprotectant transport system permease protein